MAVDKQAVLPFGASLSHDMMHHLTYLDNELAFWSLKVFPEEVEVLNSGVHYFFRSIAEACLWDYTIAAEGVLARLFEIEDGSDTQLFHLG